MTNLFLFGSLAILFFLYFIRLLRWLSFLQQKEYRFDRFLIFLNSQEGQNEFYQFLPHFNQLKWRNLKRPKLSLRMLSIIGLYLLLIFLIIYRYLLMPIFVKQTTLNVFYLTVFYSLIVLLYLAIPIVGYLASLPSQLFYYLLTNIKLMRVKRLINKHHPLIIGITGSYGKTTTKLLLAQILASKYEVFTTPKSFNTRYSLPQAILKNYRGQKIMILEYGAYAKGEIAFLAKYLPPDIAVITGFAPQHLALFGSKQAIAEAKAELILACKNQNNIYVNAQDKAVEQILQKANIGSINEAKQYSPDIFKQTKLDNQAKLNFVWQGRHIQTPLIGMQYLQALALAVGLAQKLGLKDKEIVLALNKLQTHERFIQLKYNQNQAIIVDDGYSSNPQGFKSALVIAKHLKKSTKKMYLLANGIVDLGSDCDAIHADLAKRAKEVFDQVYYFNDHGSSQFAQVFKNNYATNPQEALSLLKTANASCAFLIEGRMPPIIAKWLEKQSNANI